MEDPALPPTSPTTLSSQERNWAMLCHLITLSGMFTYGLGSLVGPLVVWLLQREKYPFVDDQGKEALNFQITVLIASAVCVALMAIAIGFVLLIILGIVDLVLVVTACIRASKGQRYRYPFAIRLVK